MVADHPLAAEHIEAEGAAEAVYPFVLFGRGESHPRAGVGEPSVAPVQGIGCVGDVQYVVEGIPFLGYTFAAGAAGGEACQQQSREYKRNKFMSHIVSCFII